MAPRPILKSLPKPEISLNASLSDSSPLPFTFCSSMNSPHVHFPPTPALTTTETTHSPFVYDRAPIAVGPNACQLPERGERVYASSVKDKENRRERRTTAPNGSYFHPRAFEACERELVARFAVLLNPPTLIPDQSSSSSESSSDSDDSPVPPIPTISVHLPPRTKLNANSTNMTNTNTNIYTLHHQIPRHDEDALLFLPHSPAKQRRTRSKRVEQSRMRAGSADEVVMSNDGAFCQPALDGCLGGF